LSPGRGYSPIRRQSSIVRYTNKPSSDADQGSPEEAYVGTEKNDCDEDRSFFEGSLDPSDTDMFEYSGVDDGLCAQQANVELQVDGGGSAAAFKLCVYPSCAGDLEGTLDCQGDSEFFGGGCCNLEGAEPVVPFDITCASGVHDSTIRVEVTPRSGLVECTDYQVLYRF
jgi:hypothetical protein